MGALQGEESDGNWREEGTKAADGVRMAKAQIIGWVGKGEGGAFAVWAQTVKAWIGSQTESVGVAHRQGLFTNSHKSLHKFHESPTRKKISRFLISQLGLAS